jgi:hypothetical protein
MLFKVGCSISLLGTGGFWGINTHINRWMGVWNELFYFNVLASIVVMAMALGQTKTYVWHFFRYFSFYVDDFVELSTSAGSLLYYTAAYSLSGCFLV